MHTNARRVNRIIHQISIEIMTNCLSHCKKACVFFQSKSVKCPNLLYTHPCIWVMTTVLTEDRTSVTINDLRLAERVINMTFDWIPEISRFIWSRPQAIALHYREYKTSLIIWHTALKRTGKFNYWRRPTSLESGIKQVFIWLLETLWYLIISGLVMQGWWLERASG